MPVAFGSGTFWECGEDVVAQLLIRSVFSATQVYEVPGDRFEHPSSPGVRIRGEKSGVVGINGAVSEDFTGVIG